jgi:hypothetical protein
MKHILTLVLLVSLGFAQSFTTVNTVAIREEKPTTISRTCTVNGVIYVVTYEYNALGMSSVPATYPPGQPHYPCNVTVYKAAQVGKSFRGEVTPSGCFEDIPSNMVQEALDSIKPKP